MKITDKVCLFWSDEDVFSNFYPAPITLSFSEATRLWGEFTVPTSEHAFMFYKAMYFDDVITAEQIINEPRPYGAKKLGRSVKNFNVEIWDQESLSVMYYVNTLKYQDSVLAQVLIDTGDRLIAEASPYDKIWGIGLSEDDPKALDPTLWRGENHLGNVLMKIRKILTVERRVNNPALSKHFLRETNETSHHLCQRTDQVIYLPRWPYSP